jgi:hypothetical protein
MILMGLSEYEKGDGNHHNDDDDPTLWQASGTPCILYPNDSNGFTKTMLLGRCINADTVRFSRKPHLSRLMLLGPIKTSVDPRDPTSKVSPESGGFVIPVDCWLGRLGARSAASERPSLFGGRHVVLQYGRLDPPDVSAGEGGGGHSGLLRGDEHSHAHHGGRAFPDLGARQALCGILYLHVCCADRGRICSHLREVALRM